MEVNERKVKERAGVRPKEEGKAQGTGGSSPGRRLGRGLSVDKVDAQHNGIQEQRISEIVRHNADKPPQVGEQFCTHGYHHVFEMNGKT